MLPNWLYGKSKSKLANILGGGGGTPADYNQVKAQVNQNTEDIELLSDALDDKAAKTQITNPNILHNPWFTINQRNSGKITAGGNYPCDRWRTAGAGTLDITATTDGLAIVNTSSESDAYVIQRRTATYVNSLRGHKLTGSIMLSDGTIYSGTINPPYADNTYFENEDVKIYTNFNTSSVEAFCIQVKAGKSLTIRAAKLEVGEISTLARDPRPEYALELAKCQRYFQHFRFSAGIPIGLGYASGTNSARIIIPLSMPMRTTGNDITTITNGNENIVIHDNSNTAHAVSDLHAYINECYCTLFITTTGLSNGTLCVARQGTNAFELSLSAEL